MTDFTPEQLVALRQMGRFIILYGRNPFEDTSQSEYTHLGRKFTLETLVGFGYQGYVTILTDHWKADMFFSMQASRTITDFSGRKIKQPVFIHHQPMMEDIDECLRDRDRRVGNNSLSFWFLTFGRANPKKMQFSGDRAKFEADLIIVRATGQMLAPMKAVP